MERKSGFSVEKPIEWIISVIIMSTLFVGTIYSLYQINKYLPFGKKSNSFLVFHEREQLVKKLNQNESFTYQKEEKKLLIAITKKKRKLQAHNKKINHRRVITKKSVRNYRRRVTKKSYRSSYSRIKRKYITLRKQKNRSRYRSLHQTKNVYNVRYLSASRKSTRSKK